MKSQYRETRATKPRENPYIRTASGKQVFFLEAHPDVIDIGDAAKHLSRTYRFNGVGISVAQHMVVGARLAKRFYRDHSLLPARFLVHDVAEYILGDVSSPLKRLLPDFSALETQWDLAVEEKFNVLFIGLPSVQELDFRMLLTERLTAQPMLTREDDFNDDFVEFPLDEDELEELFTPWAPEVSEHEYLLALHENLPWVTS